MPSSTNQLWIILKIWFFSVVFNTLAGTVYLVASAQSTGSAPELLAAGAFFGGLFSLPGIPVLFLVLNRCVRRDISSRRIFRAVLLAVVVLSLITSLFFIFFLGEMDRTVAWFPVIAVLSAVTGTATQYRQIRDCIPELPELD